MIELSRHATHRRGFLGRLGTAAIALAAGSVAPSSADARSSVLPERLDPPDQDAWLRRIRGKHRQFFDGVTPSTAVLIVARNFLDQNNRAYGIPDRELTAVIGLRHLAVPLAISDAVWSKYKLGESLNVQDPATRQPAERNVFAHVRAGDLPSPSLAVDALLARGVIITVCNVALASLSESAAQRAGVTSAEAKHDWLAGLLTGTTLVPAGVVAANRAQEQRCTYCYAG